MPRDPVTKAANIMLRRMPKLLDTELTSLLGDAHHNHIPLNDHMVGSGGEAVKKVTDDVKKAMTKASDEKRPLHEVLNECIRAAEMEAGQMIGMKTGRNAAELKCTILSPSTAMKQRNNDTLWYLTCYGLEEVVKQITSAAPAKAPGPGKTG